MRLLYLLNKKPKSVVMPPDGVQLLVWAEQVLVKYPKVRSQAKPEVLCNVLMKKILIKTCLSAPSLLLDPSAATIKQAQSNRRGG